MHFKYLCSAVQFIRLLTGNVEKKCKMRKIFTIGVHVSIFHQLSDGLYDPVKNFVERSQSKRKKCFLSTKRSRKVEKVLSRAIKNNFYTLCNDRSLV